MTVLFSDGFESGDFSAWGSATQVGVGSAASVAGGGVARSGSFGARMYKPTGSNNGYARATVGIGDTNEIVTVDVYMYVQDVVSSGSGYMVIMEQTSPLNGIVNGILVFNGAFYLGFRKLDGTTQAVPFSTPLIVDTWYRITLVYDASGVDPVASVYVDGVLVASATDVTSGTVYLPNQVLIEFHEASWSSVGDVYFDDIQITDALPDFGGALIIPQIQLHRRQLWSG